VSFSPFGQAIHPRAPFFVKRRLFYGAGAAFNSSTHRQWRMSTKTQRHWLNGSMASLDDPILVRLRTALEDACGDGLERVILFGSRARGEAHLTPTVT
jgi:hypothetical protein